MSGHSKWATIKHKKGAADAKRGKIFTKLIKELTIAARMGGGDPGGNPRLRRAVADAKSQEVPNDTINKAIKRGTGELDGGTIDEVLYEGTGPGGTLFMVQGTTDNRNRTVAALRKIFDKNNAQLGSSGTAAWAFDRKGLVVLDLESANEDTLMEIVADAGGDDYQEEGDEWNVYCEPEVLETLNSAFEKANIPVKSSSLAYVPKIKKPISGRDAELALKLADQLDDNDDVDTVFADFDISDEELERISNT
jgi:YebC/PmpR family DNA-binding regulatory protein